MKALHYVMAMALSLSVLACGTGKEITDTTDRPEFPKGIIVDDYDTRTESASFEITDVSLDGDILILKVSYSGGCKDHSFDLIGSPNIMKSMPPKRGIRLIHHNNEDTCREWIDEELKFDISDFAYPGSEIKLMLEGYEPEISYSKS